MATMNAIIEQSFIAPYSSTLEKLTRNSEKMVAKLFPEISKQITKLDTVSSNEKEQALAECDRIIKHIRNLQSKLNDSQLKKTSVCAKRISSRLAYLSKETETESSSSDMVDDERTVIQDPLLIDRAIIDHLSRTDCLETARFLAKEKDIRALVDVDMFAIATKVIQDLRKKSCKLALQWCGQERSRLTKIIDCDFEFHLRLQEFIVLIQANNAQVAIEYAQQYITPLTNDQNKQSLQSCMGLLMFPSTKLENLPQELKGYATSNRWEILISQFKTCFSRVNKFLVTSLLDVYLQVGVSALKTRQCNKSEHYPWVEKGLNMDGKTDMTESNILSWNESNDKLHDETDNNCPICTSSFAKLSRGLPICTRPHSQLVCRLSGEPMNDLNPPMVLPNGHAYGKNALQKIANQLDGALPLTITNTETSSSVKMQLSDCKQVFVM